MLHGDKLLSQITSYSFKFELTNTTTRFKIGIKIVVFQLVQDKYTIPTEENKEIFTEEADKWHMPDFDMYPSIEKNKKRL